MVHIVQSTARRGTRSICVVEMAEPLVGRKEKLDSCGSFECLGSKPQKRTLRRSMSSATATDEEEKATKDIESKESNYFLDVDLPGKGGRKKQDPPRDIKLTGVKRKRNQVGLQESYQGWTKKQEVALHKAYFTAKPRTYFWKKVAKLVPGKSSQECFDKIHSENLTPLCTKPTSKTKKQNSPSG